MLENIVSAEDRIPFRVHHILCTQLYRGLGYSGAFCENMTQIVTALRGEPERELLLVTRWDAICAGCPNRENGECDALSCSQKDRHLLAPLGLEENTVYSYQQLMEHSRERLTEQVFTESCKNCNWYQKGICRYEDIGSWKVLSFRETLI